MPADSSIPFAIWAFAGSRNLPTVTNLSGSTIASSFESVMKIASCPRCLAIWLFVFIRLQVRRDGTPEQARLNLYRNMPRVVGVPDPDSATVLHDTLLGRRLDFERLEGSGRGLDLFLGLDLHDHGHGS